LVDLQARHEQVMERMAKNWSDRKPQLVWAIYNLGGNISPFFPIPTSCFSTP